MDQGVAEQRAQAIRTAIDFTPPSPAHRVLAGLNFANIRGRGKDGDVIKKSTLETGELIYELHAQPRAHGVTGELRDPVGISFFVPNEIGLALAHKRLNKEQFNCGLISANKELPKTLKFLHDHPLEFLNDDDVLTVCGEHWTLYTTERTNSTDFENLYEQLVSEFLIPCDSLKDEDDEQEGAGGENDFTRREINLEVNTDRVAGDPKTYIATMALDELADSTTNGNDKLFAYLFSCHLSATDMDFSELLQHTAMANLVAAALEVWVIRDPYIVVLTRQIQKELAAVAGVEEADIVWSKYEPYWVIHPFQFFQGEISDELYDEQVRISAQGFINDEELKRKVMNLCRDIFQNMDASSLLRTEKFEYKKLTVEVNCSFKDRHNVVGE